MEFNKKDYQQKYYTANLIRSKFDSQKAAAKKRGIPFELSFEEWWGVWQASGHWNDRGKKLGQYVMARFGDNGPYAIGNVKIITNSENSREAPKVGNITQSQGELNSKAKLTEQQVRQIFVAEGIHQNIADLYGISRSQVASIKSGYCWAHLNLNEPRMAA